MNFKLKNEYTFCIHFQLIELKKLRKLNSIVLRNIKIITFRLDD